MNKYIIFNEDTKDNERYTKSFETGQDCRHWIINHLDLSKHWHYNKMTGQPEGQLNQHTFID